MEYEITLGGRTIRANVTRERDDLLVSLDGGPVRRVRAERLGAAEWAFDEDGLRRTLGIAVRGDAIEAQHRGHGLRGGIVDVRDLALQHADGVAAGDIITQMPGLVVRVLVKPGDRVHAGQATVVVEAMKMENELRAAMDGVVVEVPAVAGTPVEAGTVLCRIAPEAA